MLWYLIFLSTWSAPGTLFFEFLECFGNSKNEVPERSRILFFEFLSRSRERKLKNGVSERSGTSFFEFLDPFGTQANIYNIGLEAIGS